MLSTISARTAARLALITLALLLGSGSVARAAGTNIGDAETLTGSASGSLPSAQADDWYVVYPSSRSAQVTITVSNTTPSGTPPACSLVIARVTDSSGGSVGSGDLELGTKQDFAVSGSDRYFVELQDNNCNPGDDPPAAYTVKESGGGGTPLRGAPQDATPTDSIGDAGPPLTGHVAYRGSITSAGQQDWLVFDVAASSSPVTVRVDDSTLKGNPCSPLIVAVTDTFGGAFASADLEPGSAQTFSVSEPGRYFVRLADNNCNPTADRPVAYQVQLDPAGSLTQPPAPARQPLTGGATQTEAAGPLAGGVDYTDTIPNATTTRWYDVRVNGTGSASITVENTSEPDAPCSPLIVRIVDASGRAVGSADLATDRGYTFSTSAAGLYYVSLTDNNCEPGAKPPMRVQLGVTPPSAVTPGPAFGGPQPPRCQDVTATAQENAAVTLRLMCTGLGPLTYTVTSPPSHGSLSGLDPATGTVVYTPNHNYGGPDSFIYSAGDAYGFEAAAATASITVTLATGAGKGGSGDHGGSTTPKPPRIKVPGKGKGKHGKARTPRRVVSPKRKAAFRAWLKSQWKELAPVCGSYEVFTEAVSAVELEAGWWGRAAKFVTDKMMEATLTRCKTHLKRLLRTYTELKKDPPSRRFATVALPAAATGPTAARCPRGLPGQTVALLARCDALLAAEAAKDKALDRVTAIDAALATAIDRGTGARKAHDASAQRLQWTAVQALLAEDGDAMADDARARRALATAIGASGLDPRLSGRAAAHPLAAFKALRHDRHTSRAVRRIAGLLVAGAHGKAGALAPPATYRAALRHDPSTASIAAAAGSLAPADLETLVAGLRRGHQLSASHARSLTSGLRALAKASGAKRTAALARVGTELRATGGAAGTLLRAVTGLAG